MRFDDLYIDDEDFHGDCRVDALWPDGAGSYSQWTPSAGSNHENVDDADDQDDDGTYNSTDVADEIDTYTFDGVASVAGSEIIALAVNLAARKDDAGQRGVVPIIRIDSTDYAGTEFYLYDIYKIGQEVWENPPSAPSVAWSESDVNGAEFGLKLTA